MKQLQIRIYSDGKVEAKTSGIKGEKCLGYVETLEQLLDARTVESSYTDEYYQTESHNVENIEQQNEERHNVARINRR